MQQSPPPNAAPSDLAALEGDALVDALRRRYAAVESLAHADGRPWRVLRPRSPDDLLDQEAFERDGKIPYWAELWPSSQVLGDRLAQTPGAGRSLLELGCGVGLLALVAADAGYRALASDYYPEALDFVRANAWLNGQAPPATRMLDWRGLPADLPTFDAIVAADVLYEPEHADLVAGAIARTLAPGGLAWVADPGRPTAARFTQRCREAGLEALREALPLACAGLPLTITIYTLRWA